MLDVVFIIWFSVQYMHVHRCSIDLGFFIIVCLFPGRRTAYNWLTGSSVDTLAEYTLGSESLSSLLAFDKKVERQSTTRRPVGEGFGTKRLTAAYDEVDSHTRG